MPAGWVCALISVVAVSLTSFIGLLTFSMDSARLQQMVFLMVSLAVGAMFGDAFIHLLPEAFERAGSSRLPSLWVLVGLLTFFVLEKFLHWRHEHVIASNDAIKPFGYMNLFAESLCNLTDGVLIGASYLVSIRLGIATTTAVLLHEIPQELGNFGILLHAGFEKSSALRWNLLSASVAIIGAVGALTLGAVIDRFAEAVIPFAAGGFIYLA